MTLPIAENVGLSDVIAIVQNGVSKQLPPEALYQGILMKRGDWSTSAFPTVDEETEVGIKSMNFFRITAAVTIGGADLGEGALIIANEDDPADEWGVTTGWSILKF